MFRRSNGCPHAYPVYRRDNEETLGDYMYFDITPKRHNEAGPNHSLTDWVRPHDRYDASDHVDMTGCYHAPERSRACYCETGKEPTST